MVYPVTSVTERENVTYSTFSSVDFGKASSNIADNNSPSAMNIIRDEYGKIKKRLGYFERMKFSDKIYGIKYYEDEFLIHSGIYLYKEDGTEMFSAMNEDFSYFWEEDELLYIMDGVNFLVYDGETVSEVEGKIPLIIITGTPSGGGVAFESVNLISDKWQQSFIGDGSTRKYQLAFDELSSSTVTVELATLEEGETVWTTMTSSNYTVDTENGTVTFDTAPAVPSIANEDNVKITAQTDRSESRNKILNSRIYKRFGINGHENQLFVSGNSDYGNYIFWSAIDDITYYPDIQYAILGEDDVGGFGNIDTTLLVYKKDSSAYMCSVYLETVNELYQPQIVVEKVVSTSGCVSFRGTGTFGEPIYISSVGVCSISYRDLSAQEYEINRGDRINEKLLDEENLSDLFTIAHDNFYYIFINSKVYILDRLNFTSGNYNGFLWDDIPATTGIMVDDVLFFGTEDGSVMEFYQDETMPTNYNDNGSAYDCYWETAEFVGDNFYSKKTVKYLAIKAKAYVKTGVKVEILVNGLWDEIFEDKASFGYLDLNYIDFNRFTLSTDKTTKKVGIKYNRRNLDRLAFRLSNNNIDEPFGLYSFAFEYKEKGKHK